MSTTPEPVFPNDRELALHEIKSLAEQLRSANLHVYTKPDWRRDRIIGWILTVVILSGIGWTVFYNYTSAQELRHGLLQACLDSNDRTATQRSLYDEVAKASKDPALVGMLGRASSGLTSIDCTARYLH